MFKKITPWAFPVFILLLLMIAPFVIFGDQVERWVKNFVADSPANHWLTALIFGLILASDILVPVPSSFVSTIAGYLLGFWEGTMASVAGMTLSCLIGYWIGYKPGRSLTKRLVGATELSRLDSLRDRFGDWVYVITRPVPVLAETAVLGAGISHMPLRRFLILTISSNLGVSAVYALTGAYSFRINSFLLAFLGTIIVPGITMLALRKTIQ